MRLIDGDAVLEFMRDRLDMQELYLPIHFKEFVIDEMPTVSQHHLADDGTLIVRSDVDGVKRVIVEDGTLCKTFYVDGEPKQGRWICGCCSHCGYVLTTTGLKNYCPNCGASMKEVTE